MQQAVHLLFKASNDLKALFNLTSSTEKVSICLSPLFTNETNAVGYPIKIDQAQEFQQSLKERQSNFLSSFCFYEYCDLDELGKTLRVLLH